MNQCYSSTYWIEPLAGRIAGAPAGAHVIYAGSHVIPSGGMCANPSTGLPPTQPPGPPPHAPGPIVIRRTELACDADFEFFTFWGSQVSTVQQRIELLTNIINLQYESEVEITHQLTTIIVRTTSSDPYTESDSDPLLCEFITEWTANQQHLDFDVAKLFTGRDLTGSIIGQAANFGEICDRQGFCTLGLDDGEFCHSQILTNPGSTSIACATDLMAHELGHLWGALHCSCPNFTMNPTLQCANTFSSDRRAAIAIVRDTRLCLDNLLEEVWVQFGYTGGVETGAWLFPYNTLAEGMDFVQTGGAVRMKADSTSETINTDKAAVLSAEGGTVVIGQ